MIKAYSGSVLVDPIKEASSNVEYGISEKGRIYKGKVLHVGDPEPTSNGSTIPCYLQKDQIVYYLRYEGGYDQIITEEGKELHFVLFKDFRGME
jgi:co-chaperonin GroES (HSP10)